MNFHIITIFPNQLSEFIKEGILRIAQEKKAVNIRIYDLRKWGIGKHKRVDDRPFGGGAGMLLMPEPVFNAVEEIKKSIGNKVKVWAMTPSGVKFTQKKAADVVNSDITDYIILCGHYEGFDQRIIDGLVDEQVSIGDFVLSGGELPALILIDAISRLIPGVLGNESSLDSETHNEDGYKDFPNWTRPEDFRGMKVPKVLLEGNHRKIAEFRKK